MNVDPEQAVQQSADRHPEPSVVVVVPNIYSADTMSRKLIIQQLALILHAHRCRRKDAMHSGGTVQPVSRFYKFAAVSLNNKYRYKYRPCY